MFLEVLLFELNAIQILINEHEFLFGNVNIELINVPCDQLFFLILSWYDFQALYLSTLTTSLKSKANCEASRTSRVLIIQSMLSFEFWIDSIGHKS